MDGLSLGHGDEKIRTAAVKRMCDHVDLAEKLGGSMVIIGAIRGRYADAPSEVIYYQQFHKSMEELIPYAEKKRIVIIFEANDHLETDAYISIKDLSLIHISAAVVSARGTEKLHGRNIRDP